MNVLFWLANLGFAGGGGAVAPDNKGVYTGFMANVNKLKVKKDKE